MEPGILHAVMEVGWRNPTYQRIIFGDDERGEFTIKVFAPGDRPTLPEVTGFLGAVDRRLRLALLFAFLEPEEIGRCLDLHALLDVYPTIPLAVSGIDIGNVTAHLKGSPREIAEVLGRREPPKDWKRKLSRNIAAIFAAVAIGVGADELIRGHDVLLPSAEELRATVEHVCGALPKGTVVTFKAGIVEVEIHCDPPASPEQATHTR